MLRKRDPKIKRETPHTPARALTLPSLPSNAMTLRGAPTLDSHSPHSTSHQPMSATEQYWATRALRAETLLTSRTAHHADIRRVLMVEETKRSRQLAALAQEHETRHARAEKLVIALLVCVMVLSALIAYLLSKPKTLSPPQRWIFPSHFTIPVLSPFTSVVEHETSVFGFRTLAAWAVVLAVLSYAVWRHWMAKARFRRPDL